MSHLTTFVDIIQRLAWQDRDKNLSSRWKLLWMIGPRKPATNNPIVHVCTWGRNRSQRGDFFERRGLLIRETTFCRGRKTRSCSVFPRNNPVGDSFNCTDSSHNHERLTKPAHFNPLFPLHETSVVHSGIVRQRASFHDPQLPFHDSSRM